MGTKFISGLANVQAPLIKKQTAFGSKVSPSMDMLRHDRSRYVAPAVLEMAEIIAYLNSEGWQASGDEDRLVVVTAGTAYERTPEYLMACDYADLPQPLADDIRDAMHAQGFCT